ncbi:hypothetical protein H6G93_09290 [Nostoc sp. FACHB-973]|nr:hypothetical protein [Nostoc sp. FACHB-973]
MKTDKEFTTQALISPEVDAKIVDQILLQAGGVGLGITLSIFGLVLISNWLGIKPAISEWVKRQQTESQILKTISESLTAYLKDYQQNHTSYLENNTKVISKLDDIEDSLDRLHDEVKSKGSKRIFFR